MSAAIQSLISTGTKLWLDSIDPDLIQTNKALGATGATSNPIIVSDLLKTGRFDAEMTSLISKNLTNDNIAWELTDRLVTDAQGEFLSVWEKTNGNDGYVSFELDPLLEDPDNGLSITERAERYIELGKKWAHGHANRMIKVPATPAGLASLEELSAAGLTLNVTLIFTAEQYEAARDAIWRGAQRRESLDSFKSVYSIFVSRIDVYAAQHVPGLSAAAQGLVGTVNAKRIWQQNREFWQDKGLKLEQEIIFASTGTKNPNDAPWQYVAALAGSDIQTNPPATNQVIAESSEVFTRKVDSLPSSDALAEIDEKVDFQHLHDVLMKEGIDKFMAPQRSLLELIESRRNETRTMA